jgi:putative transposase
MPYEPKRHTLRLSSFDYSSNGAYFVTICSDKKSPHFTDPTLRRIVEEQWNRLPLRFITITLDSFVIMPITFTSLYGLVQSKKVHHRYRMLLEHSSH